MTKNQKEELKAWSDQVRSGVRRKIDCMKEEFAEMTAYDRVLDAVHELIAENDDLSEQVESQLAEIDELNEQLEQKDAEMANMRQQHQAEMDTLQKQLLEAENQHLESEKQHLEAEAHAKPMEIHNHFESGSNSQVFNDKVNGRFTKKQTTKKDKKDKKRWKKIVRKML